MGRFAQILLSIVLLGGAAIAALLISGTTLTDLKHYGTARNAINDGGVEIRIPLPESADGRLLPKVRVASEGEYDFMFRENGEPVRYDPCRPLYYVINPDGAPTGGNELIEEAVERVSQATGLKFVYNGATTEVADFERRLFQPGQYGDEQFAPIIFGWSDELREPQFEGSVTGLGGSSSVTGAYGPDRYLTSGVVILDAPDIENLLSTDKQTKLARSVIMHEIGHVVGLAHVDDENELMNPSNQWLTDWGPGDLAGLAVLGAGPCQEV